MAAQRQSQRLKFRSAGEARDEAERMEQLRDDEVSHLRQKGDEAGADRASDRWTVEINRVRGHARTLDEQAARQTAQPAVPKPAPKTTRRSSTGDASRRRTRRVASGSRSRLGRTARSGYSRSGAQAQLSSWGDLVWQVVGLTVGVALLTLFISSSRGVGAFSGIVGGLANGLGLIVDPVDPFAKGAVKNTIEAPATAPAAAPASGRVLLSGVHI